MLRYSRPGKWVVEAVFLLPKEFLCLILDASQTQRLAERDDYPKTKTLLVGFRHLKDEGSQLSNDPVSSLPKRGAVAEINNVEHRLPQSRLVSLL